MTRDMGMVQTPSYEDIDVTLRMHTGISDPTGDIKIEKAAKYENPDAEDPKDRGAVLELPIVEGFGSSEIEDTDGDTFHESALKSLCDPSVDNTSTWEGHKFSIVNNLVGALVEPPRYQYGNKSYHTGATPPPTAKKDNWAGVWVRSDMEIDNPGLIQPKTLYPLFNPPKGSTRRAKRFGWSVGALYSKYTIKRDGRGAPKGFNVYEVYPVEWSIVGVPANQASWVETSRKHFVAKGYLETGQADDPEMAYVFKHWDELPEKDAVAMRRFATKLYEQFGLVLAEPVALGKRQVY